VQNTAYERFLQRDIAPRDRLPLGFEGILREVFPIKSFDGTASLEYVRYELGKPRYLPDECRQLRLTYGAPCRLVLRLQKEQVVEEEVYIGDIPIMLGGGEFIINGAERVVVSQLHRSPGVDFIVASEPGEKKVFSGRIIPERGSWIELTISKKDALSVRIDQSGRFAATTLLRAMCREYSSNKEIAAAFYAVKDEIVNERILKKILVDDVIYPGSDNRVGEVLGEFGERVSERHVEAFRAAGIRRVSVIDSTEDLLILNTIRDDITSSHEEALLRIYQRLRPGNPPALDKAIDLFNDRFFDLNRYRLGSVGRFRINRKFQQDIADEVMTLSPLDYINAIKYILKLRASDPVAYVDDRQPRKS